MKLKVILGISLFALIVVAVLAAAFIYTHPLRNVVEGYVVGKQGWLMGCQPLTHGFKCEDSKARLLLLSFVEGKPVYKWVDVPVAALNEDFGRYCRQEDKVLSCRSGAAGEVNVRR